MRSDRRPRAAAHPSYLASARARRRVLCVSVDLDPLPLYHGIHGLAPPPAELVDVVLARGLARFLEIFRRYGVRATFFVVGSDAETEEGRRRLRQASEEGHELGNHSHTHPYDLARLPREAMRREVLGCHQVLRRLLDGRAPRGFRSPGYDMSSELLDVIQEAGYRYDSSILPSPPYYAAKALAMGRLLLSGRRSSAVLTRPACMWAPAQPYRPDARRPHRPGQALLVEMPIAVTPRLRLPAIGTSLLVSEKLRVHLLEEMRAYPFFNLELHGIDLLDAAEDGIPEALARCQPDLRVRLKDKRRALMATLDRLRAEYEIVPLHEAAEEVHRLGALTRPLCP